MRSKTNKKKQFVRCDTQKTKDHHKKEKDTTGEKEAQQDGGCDSSIIITSNHHTHVRVCKKTEDGEQQQDCVCVLVKDELPFYDIIYRRVLFFFRLPLTTPIII